MPSPIRAFPSARHLAFLTLLVGLGVAGKARVAAAQDDAGQRERFGLIATLPTAIGFVWHLSDRLTLRPDLNISNANQTATGSILSLSPGLSLLYHPASEATTRPYGGIRFGQPRRYSEASDEVLQKQLALLVGLQHRPRDSRFAVFGEVGPMAEWDSRPVGPVTYSYTNVSLRTVIGLTWYP